MTLLSGLLAFFNRLLGNVATATVGWAAVLLYGRVPQARQTLLSMMAFGSLVWIVAVIAVLIPAVGGALIASVPRPGFIATDWLRLALIAAAVLIPPGVGLAIRAAVAPDVRPSVAGSVSLAIRGYPITAILGGTIIFLAVMGLLRKARATRRGWDDEHIPIIVKPARYPAVANDIESALRDSGLEIVRRPAPRSAEVPPRLLAVVTGVSRADALPDRLVCFVADGLEVLLYPSDVLIVGEKVAVARARAAIARRLAFADVYLTTAAESEEVEDRLVELARRRHVTAADFRPIDDRLTRLEVPYADWETIYRLRLQVEHEARLAGATGPADGS